MNNFEYEKTLNIKSPSKWAGTYESNLMMLEAFGAGQQSRQEEVNKLQSEIYDLELKLKSNDHSAREVINAMSMYCNYYLTEIDELQRKYGSVMKTNEMLVAYKNELLDEIENNIKGQSND